MKGSDSFLTLGSLNIEKGKHSDYCLPALRIHDFDTLFLQEVIQDDMPLIAAALGLKGYFAPMGFVRESTELMGLAVFAKEGMIITYDEYYYIGQGKGIYTHLSREKNYVGKSVLQSVRVEKDGIGYDVAHTHFPWTPDGFPTPVQFECMPKVLQRAKERKMVLCGDLNAPRTLPDGTPGQIWAMLEDEFCDNIPKDVTSTLDPNLHRAKPLALVVDALFTPSCYRAFDVALISDLSDHLLIRAKLRAVV